MIGKLNEMIEEILYKIFIEYFPTTLVVLLLAIGIFMGLIFHSEMAK